MRLTSCAIILVTTILTIEASRGAPATVPAAFPTTAPSRIVAVTVYQGSALVTREVQVPAGPGQIALLVSPLPPQAIDSSLYSEAGEGIRILTTRYRTRALKEDTREEVRAKEQQIKSLGLDAEKFQKQVKVIEQNLALLDKLEAFTSATMQHLAEKGLLSSEATIALGKFVMQERSERSEAQVALLQQIRANGEAQAFAQRELAEITAGAGRTERDAIIVVDKTNPAAGTIRLNYLVSAANWRPQYKLHASAEDAPVQVEYLAAILQQSGEDWTDASIVLSTAEPLLSAAPPELTALDMTVSRITAANAAAPQVAPTLGKENRDLVKQLRAESQQRALEHNYDQVNFSLNVAAALCQTDELLGAPSTGPAGTFLAGNVGSNGQREGPSVTYHLKTHFTIPSRNDEQLLEVARLEMSGEFFYKAVPVLTPHVYRLANLGNNSEYILLPGQATMYLGSDFVGQMDLPLVAIGERFTAGFGVDPQLQVARELLNKNKSVQGGNQVHDFKYRISVTSFKSKPVKMQLWDRLPRAEAEAVGVTLGQTTPQLSTDPEYLRTDRPANLLRWDLTLAPNTSGEKATTVEYQFKLEYDKNVAIGNFKARQ